MFYNRGYFQALNQVFELYKKIKKNIFISVFRFINNNVRYYSYSLLLIFNIINIYTLLYWKQKLLIIE
ncbi:hypothetical protein Yalta_058 [Yalta virus]|nr:hypothetical protein Yalta_058 [Yalta virus]